MRTAVITVEVTVDNVPDHVTDEQVISKISASVPTYNLTWPEPRAFVRSARVVQCDTTKDAPAEA
jgi:hypothetical protein